MPSAVNDLKAVASKFHKNWTKSFLPEAAPSQYARFRHSIGVFLDRYAPRGTKLFVKDSINIVDAGFQATRVGIGNLVSDASKVVRPGLRATYNGAERVVASAAQNVVWAAQGVSKAANATVGIVGSTAGAVATNVQSAANSAVTGVGSAAGEVKRVTVRALVSSRDVAAQAITIAQSNPYITYPALGVATGITAIALYKTATKQLGSAGDKVDQSDKCDIYVVAEGQMPEASQVKNKQGIVAVADLQEAITAVEGVSFSL